MKVRSEPPQESDEEDWWSPKRSPPPKPVKKKKKKRRRKKGSDVHERLYSLSKSPRPQEPTKKKKRPLPTHPIHSKLYENFMQKKKFLEEKKKMIKKRQKELRAKRDEHITRKGNELYERGVKFRQEVERNTKRMHQKKRKRKSKPEKISEKAFKRLTYQRQVDQPKPPSFKPKINKKSRRMLQEVAGRGEVNIHQSLYMQKCGDDFDRLQELRAENAEKTPTFKPNISKSQRSFEEICGMQGLFPFEMGDSGSTEVHERLYQMSNELKEVQLARVQEAKQDCEEQLANFTFKPQLIKSKSLPRKEVKLNHKTENSVQEYYNRLKKAKEIAQQKENAFSDGRNFDGKTTMIQEFKLSSSNSEKTKLKPYAKTYVSLHRKYVTKTHCAKTKCKIE